MLARYRILEKIGSGGIGVVFRAEDVTLKRHVALKVLSERSFAHQQARARFLREARIAAALNHPNICTIHEVGEVRPGEEQTLETGERLEAGSSYLALELIEGRTLHDILTGGPLALEELLRIAVRVSEGLAEAHAKGVIHRDLKPQNVMVTPEGRVKILDFGLAKPLKPPERDDRVMTDAASASVELTFEGMVIGTVAYMSPEQAQGGPVDSRSDIFSFGILLYEMAAGKRPFWADTGTATLAKIIEAEPAPLSDARSDLPPELHRIVSRCLRKSP
ncbi:MAG: serine/threonine-protein kinase, partial [Planctomycetota bacterium]